jgi:hypothetical protein
MDHRFNDNWIYIDNFHISSVIDATECYINKKIDKSESNEFYSGYKKNCTLKYSVVSTLFKKLIIFITGPHKGPEHDREMIKHSNIYLDLLRKNNC